MVRYASHGTGITGGSGATSVTLGPETSSTPVAGANDTAIGATTRRYTFFTLPAPPPIWAGLLSIIFASLIGELLE